MCLSLASLSRIPFEARKMLSAAVNALFPLILTIPIAEIPPPVAMAAIVSDKKTPPYENYINVIPFYMKSCYNAIEVIVDEMYQKNTFSYADDIIDYISPIVSGFSADCLQKE